jgi:hypothetical protein
VSITKIDDDQAKVPEEMFLLEDLVEMIGVCPPNAVARMEP